MVYFAQDAETGLIKIGCSRLPFERVARLEKELGTRLIMLAVMPGWRRLEFSLHCVFAASRVRGEWFTPNKELVEFVLALAETEPTKQKRLG